MLRGVGRRRCRPPALPASARQLAQRASGRLQRAGARAAREGGLALWLRAQVRGRLSRRRCTRRTHPPALHPPDPAGAAPAAGHPDVSHLPRRAAGCSSGDLFKTFQLSWEEGSSSISRAGRIGVLVQCRSPYIRSGSNKEPTYKAQPGSSLGGNASPDLNLSLFVGSRIVIAPTGGVCREAALLQAAGRRRKRGAAELAASGGRVPKEGSFAAGVWARSCRQKVLGSEVRSCSGRPAPLAPGAGACCWRGQPPAGLLQRASPGGGVPRLRRRSGPEPASRVPASRAQAAAEEEDEEDGAESGSEVRSCSGRPAPLAPGAGACCWRGQPPAGLLQRASPGGGVPRLRRRSGPEPASRVPTACLRRVARHRRPRTSRRTSCPASCCHRCQATSPRV